MSAGDPLVGAPGSESLCDCALTLGPRSVHSESRLGFSRSFGALSSWVLATGTILFLFYLVNLDSDSNRPYEYELIEANRWDLNTKCQYDYTEGPCIRVRGIRIWVWESASPAYFHHFALCLSFLASIRLSLTLPLSFSLLFFYLSFHSHHSKS